MESTDFSLRRHVSHFQIQRPHALVFIEGWTCYNSRKLADPILSES